MPSITSEPGGAVPGAPLDDLPLSERKQQFSLGFVRMVAAAAGCSVKEHAADYDGVDITIVSSTEYERYYRPQFELQVKCTSQDGIIRSDSVAWRMEAGPFRRLTNPKSFCATYLGVLLVPADVEDWLSQDDEQLIARSRMYWQRAADLGQIDGSTGTKTVYLPRDNLFDVQRLRGIMETLGNGGGA